MIGNPITDHFQTEDTAMARGRKRRVNQEVTVNVERQGADDSVESETNTTGNVMDSIEEEIRRTYKRPLSLVVDGGVFERIKELSKRDGESVSQWVRDAVDMRMFQDLRHLNEEGGEA